MDAPYQVHDLIERFQRNRDEYRDSSFNETQLRHDFLNPIFEAMGWDVLNREGRSERYRDVVLETRIQVEESRRAPDYCFRIGSERKFFVEAKKPAVDIATNWEPAFQLRRYGWSAKLPLSILTDFEEFAVYDCRVKPRRLEKASNARIMYFRFDQLPEHWEKFSGIFSRTSILQGAFDRYAERDKIRGTAAVDDDFLAEIERWRALLATSIAQRNREIGTDDLNYAVQATIDRIIFLRICEDRGIEDYGTLEALKGGKNIYAELRTLFTAADARYNSGLFHFKRERGRDSPDELTPGLEIQDEPLKEIIRNLYYPESPYVFDAISADVLGHVYERFLGNVITLDRWRRATLEQKPEVRKAGGVFYTPTYIVEYIVANTIGKQLEGKTPEETDLFRLLDPSCGSGSFLIGAYQYLMDWHLERYAATPERYARGGSPRIYSATEEQANGATREAWRLALAEKKRILLASIYGVDIDAQAVEVTKLSLLLKMLEGETSTTLGEKEKHLLPELGNNIKCGNTLIGPDFYDDGYAAHTPEDIRRINTFNWNGEEGFPEIMADGGFDAVIGNPPYVRQEMLGEIKPYLQQKYNVYHGAADLYAYFFERGMDVLRTGGSFAFIVANKWMRANYGAPLRRWLQQQRVEEVIDFGDLRVFQDATTYPCIITLRKEQPAPAFDAVQVATLAFTDLREYVQEQRFPVLQASLSDTGWSLVRADTQQLLDRLFSVGVPLGEYANGKIFRGVLTGLNEAFVIDEETRERLIAADPKSAEIIKPFLAGRDIKRYAELPHKQYLILFPKGWTNNESGKAADKWKWLKKAYPALANHLAPFQEKAEKRYDKGEYWWELRACDYYDEFEKPKIVYAEIATRGQFSIEADCILYDTTAYILGSSSLYLLGILNSRLWTFMFSSVSSEIRGGFFRWKRQYMTTLPIRTIDDKNKADRTRHDKMVTLVEQMLELHRAKEAARTPTETKRITRQITATDTQIDRLVYELYELTNEEIAVVEEKE